MELTATFMVLLEGLAPVFTAPSFATFRLLMSGWILSTRHRYVTDLIVSSDSVGNGHFSDYHRFFSHAAWDLDQLWKRVAILVVHVFVGPDAVITLTADDTLCRKRGLFLFGAGMHHDPLISSRAKKLVSWGHDWVILSVVVAHPRWAPSKVFALPICARLYRNRQGLTKGQRKQQRSSRKSGGKKRTTKTSKAQQRPPLKTGKSLHRTRPELLTEMLVLVSDWFPDRRLYLVVDSLYSGKSVLSQLPVNIDLIGPVHPKAALYAPAPKATEKRRGGPRKKGDRLADRETWAADKKQPWSKLSFDQYGLHGEFRVKTRQGLYYKAGKDRLLNFVLSKNTDGQRPTQIFYSTDLTLSARQLLSQFSCRWSSEVMHYDVKQHLGFEDPANRTPKAVQRTAPMALLLYSLTMVWYDQEGRRHVQFPLRPWYRKKVEPSFADMLTTLRRITWEEKQSTVRPRSTLPDETTELLTYLATLAG